MKLFKNKSNRKGFTLIELLVVVAIVGLLASIILASMNGAKIKAQNSYTLQQARQWVNAFNMIINQSCNHFTKTCSPLAAPLPAGYYCAGKTNCFTDLSGFPSGIAGYSSFAGVVDTTPANNFQTVIGSYLKDLPQPNPKPIVDSNGISYTAWFVNDGSTKLSLYYFLSGYTGAYTTTEESKFCGNNALGAQAWANGVVKCKIDILF